MKVKNGNYVVAKLEGSKTFISGKVVRVDGTTAVVVVNDVPHIRKRKAELPLSSILVNLGDDPSPGKVYGQDFTHLYRGNTEVPKLGLRLNWFYLPEKKQKESLERAFRIVAKKLKPLGLSFLLNNDNSVWEVQGSRSGKYSGMYLHPRAPMAPGRLQICPNKAAPSDYPYIIAHELGHRLHLKYAQDPRLNAKWLHLFSTSIKLVKIEKAKSKEFLEALVEGDVRPSAFARELGDEDALLYKWIIRYISSTRALSIHDLDDLFKAQSFDEIRNIWPVQTIPKKELAPVVSEYATKNVRELIAEAFSYYVTGKTLPKSVTKLVERTITAGKHNYKHPD